MDVSEDMTGDEDTRIVYISIQTADAGTMREPVRQLCEETGWEVDLRCYNAEAVDDDPLVYHDMVKRIAAADLTVIRCMTDPTRMKRFRDYEPILRDSDAYVMIYSGNADVCFAYRSMFKGTDSEYVQLREFIRGRGAENDRNIVIWLNHMLTGEGEVPEPVVNRANGIYHRGMSRDITLEDYLETLDPDRPTVGLMFPANLWIYDNMDHIDRLTEELESRGMNVIPVFFSSIVHNDGDDPGTLGVVTKYFIDGERCRIDSLVMASPFSQLNTSRDCTGVTTPDEQNFFHTLMDIPVFQTMAISGHFSDYEESASGLGKAEFSMSVVWPELDGQIITVPLASNEGGSGGPKRYSPIEDRIEHLAAMVKRWTDLSLKPRSERRIAVLFYQSRPESGRIGNAAGLDTIESACDMLKRYSADGYTVDHVPEDGKALVNELQDNVTNDLEWSSSERIREKAAYLMDRKEYRSYYDGLPEFNRRQIEETWGEPPGEVNVDKGKLVIPGVVNGNIYLGYQPLRSWADRMESMYHDPVVPMPHQYLAFYRWLRDVFKADAVIHMGTHGTLEWLPGKSLALSSKCYPDLVLGGIPNIYPYIIDDPGEGIQCKRRSEAVLIGHMCPTMTRAGGYDELSKVEVPLQQYLKTRNVAGERRTAMLTEILDGIRELDMFDELSIPRDAEPDDLQDLLPGIYDYIEQLKDALVRDGLHVLGRAPEGELMDETIYSFMRLRNGNVPSLRGEYAAQLGFDCDSLLDDPSGETDGRLNSEVLDSVDDGVMGLLAHLRESGYDPASVDTYVSDCKDGLRTVTDYICNVLSVNLGRMTDEMDNMMHACDGGYVLPGPSGAPTRGNAHILPMGRNYYGIDPDTVPPRSSWEVGRRMADQMIQRYIDEKGTYPREIGFIIWATDTMKTNGDDVAYILWLMGVRPVWSDTGGQVTGLEVIPLEELGRPRIDVTVRITGLFRDAFPNLIDLIDDAVALVGDLDESEDDNYLAANLRKDIIESIEKGMAVDEARRQNSIRVFGCPPGGYGPGINHAVETGDWKTVQDLADIYVAWGSYGYGRGVSGVQMKDQFIKRFSKVGVTVKNMPDREIDLLDIDDVYGYLGGLNAFTKAYGNKDAISVMGDGSDPDKVKIRDTADELKYVFRTKVLNPKFIEGLKRHGYRGVAEVANLTEYTFGWDATSDVVDDWMYEGLAERYLFDEDTKEWMKDENPNAMMEVLNRLMEAYDRGMWNAKQETLDKLRDLFLELEERIEEVNDR